MDSVHLFFSKDEKYLVNIYIEVSLYEIIGDSLMFKQQLGKLKNPDMVCFSEDGKRVAVKNNNNIIEVYDALSGVRTFEGKGPREFGGRIFFADDNVLLSSTEKGTVYTVDILSGKVNCYEIGSYDYMELVEINSCKYLILSNERSSNVTDFHLLTFSGREASIKPLYSTSTALDTHSAAFYDDKLYAVSKDNELYVYGYNKEYDLLEPEKTISLLLQEDSEPFSDDTSEWVWNLIKSVDADFSYPIFPIGISATSNDKYIVVSFNTGIAVVDINEWKCERYTPTKYRISFVASTDNNSQIWFATSSGIKRCAVESVLNGVPPQEVEFF